MTEKSTNSSALDRRLRDLVGGERRTQVEFLRALGEYDHLRGYESLGYATLWEYCRGELKLLGGQIFRRVHCARILRKIPEAAEYLLDGRMSMTTLAILKDVISTENAGEFLGKCAGKSKKDVEFTVACAQAKVVSVKEVLRKIPSRTVQVPFPSSPPPEPQRPAVGADPRSLSDGSGASNSSVDQAVEDAIVALPPRKVEIVTAMTAEQYLLKLFVRKDFVDMLEKARNAVSHIVPDGSLEGVLREGLKLLLVREEKKHRPKTSRGGRAKAAANESGFVSHDALRPAEAGETASGRIAISSATLRALWEKEGGACTAPLANGGICGSQWQLQTEHRIPVARGGTNDLENLCLRCRQHNMMAARDVFGAAFMEKWERRG